MKTSSIKILGTTLVALACMLVLPVGNAAKHKKHDQQSLLEECQGTSALPSPNCGHTPAVAFAENNHMWLAFVQHGHIYLTHSDDFATTFSAPVVVNRTPEAIYSDGENRPKLAIGSKGEIYLSWTHKTPGKYSGDVRFSRSLDNGLNFAEPLTINDNHDLISHRFDSMAVDNQGRIYLAWIDKRDLTAAEKSGKEYPGAAIYFAISENRGESFNTNQKLVDHSCECCRIGMDRNQQEQIVVLWRHVYPNNIRDHAISLLSPKTKTIQGLPIRATNDAWQVEGCPHHGPDLSAGKGQKVHLAWFSKGEKNAGLMYGRFDLAKQSMDFEIKLDGSASASRPQVLATDHIIYTAWKSFNGEATELLLQQSTDAGLSWSPATVLAQTSNGSDHPDLIETQGRVFLSWHTLADGYRLIPIAAVEQESK